MQAFDLIVHYDPLYPDSIRVQPVDYHKSGTTYVVRDLSPSDVGNCIASFARRYVTQD